MPKCLSTLYSRHVPGVRPGRAQKRKLREMTDQLAALNAAIESLERLAPMLSSKKLTRKREC
jgi:hypothetical protein